MNVTNPVAIPSSGASDTAVVAPRRSMPAFVWEDPLLLEGALSEDERMIRDAAHRLLPGEAAAPRGGGLPRGAFRPRDHERVGRDGLPRRHAADGYGCAGVNYVAYGLIAREVEASTAATARPMSVQSSAGDVPDLRLRLGGAEGEVPAEAAHRRIIGCFGLTEPDGGSDPASMRTRAKKVDGGYVAERLEDLDHQLADRRRRRGLGQGRRGHPAASWSSAA